MTEGEHPNCQAVEDFLNAIPAVNRPICKTARIDEKPVHEGYMAAWNDSKTGKGFTAVAFGEPGHMTVIIHTPNNERLDGPLSDATNFGAFVNNLLFG